MAVYMISRWLEQGVFPCLEKGHLRSLLVVVVTETADLVHEHIGLYQPPLMSTYREVFRFELTEINCNNTMEGSNGVGSIPGEFVNKARLHDAVESLNEYTSDMRQLGPGKRVSLSFVLEYSSSAPIQLQPEWFSKSSSKNPLPYQGNERQIQKGDIMISCNGKSPQLQLAQQSQESMEEKLRSPNDNNFYLGSFQTRCHDVKITCRCAFIPDIGESDPLQSSVPGYFFDCDNNSDTCRRCDMKNMIVPSHLASPDPRCGKTVNSKSRERKTTPPLTPKRGDSPDWKTGKVSGLKRPLNRNNSPLSSKVQLKSAVTGTPKQYTPKAKSPCYSRSSSEAPTLLVSTHMTDSDPRYSPALAGVSPLK